MRILAAALVLSALSLPAHAQAIGSGAPQPSLGGGFIEFLFGGAMREPSVPRAYQPNPDSEGDVRGARRDALSFGAVQEASLPQPAAAGDQMNDASAAYAPSSQGDMTHAPVDPKFDRQEVDYQTDEKPGTIVI